VDPYSLELMARDRIRELEHEAAGRKLLAISRKRHLTTWLTAVVHLWPASAPLVSVAADPTCSGVEDREHGVSA